MEALCRELERSGAADVTAERIAGWVGGVPEGKEHCPALTAAAWRSLQEVN
jgi:hypothetical protein